MSEHDLQTAADLVYAHRGFSGVCRCGVRIPADILASSHLTDEWVCQHVARAFVDAGWTPPGVGGDLAKAWNEGAKWAGAIELDGIVSPDNPYEE